MLSPQNLSKFFLDRLRPPFRVFQPQGSTVRHLQQALSARTIPRLAPGNGSEQFIQSHRLRHAFQAGDTHKRSPRAKGSVMKHPGNNRMQGTRWTIHPNRGFMTCNLCQMNPKGGNGLGFTTEHPIRQRAPFCKIAALKSFLTLFTPCALPLMQPLLMNDLKERTQRDKAIPHTCRIQRLRCQPNQIHAGVIKFITTNHHKVGVPTPLVAIELPPRLIEPWRTPRFKGTFYRMSETITSPRNDATFLVKKPRTGKPGPLGDPLQKPLYAPFGVVFSGKNCQTGCIAFISLHKPSPKWKSNSSSNKKQTDRKQPTHKELKDTTAEAQGQQDENGSGDSTLDGKAQGPDSHLLFSLAFSMNRPYSFIMKPSVRSHTP